MSNFDEKLLGDTHTDRASCMCVLYIFMQRAEILDKLAEVQLPESELKLLYTSSRLGIGDKLYQTKE